MRNPLTNWMAAKQSSFTENTLLKNEIPQKLWRSHHRWTKTLVKKGANFARFQNYYSTDIVLKENTTHLLLTPSSKSVLLIEHWGHQYNRQLSRKKIRKQTQVQKKLKKRAGNP